MNNVAQDYIKDPVTRGVVHSNTSEYELAKTLRKMVVRILNLEHEVAMLKKLMANKEVGVE